MAKKQRIEDLKFKSTIEERKFKTSIEERKLKTNIESRYDDPYGKRSQLIDLKTQADAPSYDVIGKAKNSRVSSLLSNLRSKKDMVILQEIIGPPKSLR